MRRYVVLAFAAALVSHCGTPPPAGTVQTEIGVDEQTAGEEQDSNTITITAAAAGAALVLCYTVPKVSPKLKAKNLNCRGLIKNGSQKTGAALKKIGNKITETGRKIGQKVKNITKKSSDAADDAGSKADDAAKNSSDPS